MDNGANTRPGPPQHDVINKLARNMQIIAAIPSQLSLPIQGRALLVNRFQKDLN